jgi:predicted alpha/beta hydrolase
MIFLIIGVVVLVIMILYVCICYFIAYSAIHQNRQPVPKNTGDYGMSFENIEFKTSDGVNIKGWLIPGSAAKLIIMAHVAGLTRYGSTVKYKHLTKLYNKEIEFLKTAQHLHNAGYYVLMFDFRNHGESGPDPNKGIASIGLKEYKEYRDVVAALDYVRSRDDLRNMDLGFVSLCMGANSVIIALSKNPEKFNKVKCLFAVQPISMEVFLRNYLSTFVTLAGAKLMLPMVKKWVVWLGAYTLNQMSPLEYVGDIKVPTMYVQARNDPWTELSDIQGFYDNTPDNPKEFFWIDDTLHRFDSYVYFQNKPEKMLEWLRKWV